MNLVNNLQIGRLGEKLAKKYLRQHGFRIIEQNYRTRHAEIDLIGYDNDVLVFIEVRTKRNELFGSPEQTINQKKLKKLIQNAQAYAAIKEYTQQCRIDTICIVLGQRLKPLRITHHQDISCFSRMF